jgi:hypothetical protein
LLADVSGILGSLDIAFGEVELLTPFGSGRAAVQVCVAKAGRAAGCSFSRPLTCANSRPAAFVHDIPAEWGAMLDAETTALLRKILDEVCAAVSRDEAGARVHVASKLLESASKGEIPLKA